MDLSEWVAVEDLFALGLGLDISGAFYLGKGVLSSDEQIIDTSIPRWGFSTPLIAAQIMDRIHGRVGYALLITGFVLQIIGYSILVGVEVDAIAGAKRIVGVAAALVLGLALGKLAEWGFRSARLKPDLYRSATHLWLRSSDSQAELFSRTLRRLGCHYFPDFEGESDDAYLRRIFGKESDRMGPPKQA